MVIHPEGAPRFGLIFVCTGNICRSPFAEVLTRHWLRGRLGAGAAAFSVSSAGVAAVVGGGMHPASRAALAEWGVESDAAESFRGTQLGAAALLDADLVLGATPGHRAEVVRACPRALPIAFSILEFARLVAAIDVAELPADPISRARAVVSAARAKRGFVPAPGPAGDAIPDPISGGPAAHLKSARLCAEALDGIVAALAPPVESAFRTDVQFARD